MRFASLLAALLIASTSLVASPTRAQQMVDAEIVEALLTAMMGSMNGDTRVRVAPDSLAAGFTVADFPEGGELMGSVDVTASRDDGTLTFLRYQLPLEDLVAALSNHSFDAWTVRELPAWMDGPPRYELCPHGSVSDEDETGDELALGRVQVQFAHRAAGGSFLLVFHEHDRRCRSDTSEEVIDNIEVTVEDAAPASGDELDGPEDG